jgi:hypothetical protein
LDKRQPDRRDPLADTTFNRRSAIATAIAAFLGSLAGGVAASTIPPDKFSWTGLALVPFFLLLEAYFKYLVTLFGGNSNATRVTLAGAVVLGFYATWFATRSS